MGYLGYGDEILVSKIAGPPHNIPKPLTLKQGPVMCGNRPDPQTKVVHVAHAARWIVEVFPENCSTSSLLSQGSVEKPIVPLELKITEFSKVIVRSL